MLNAIKNNYRAVVAEYLKQFVDEVPENMLHFEIPPERTNGDLSVVLFGFAKICKKNPAEIAEGAAEYIRDYVKKNKDNKLYFASSYAKGGFLNIVLDKRVLAQGLNKFINSKNSKMGHTDVLAGEKIMVEFSCPNTNKPLHLGHMRNDSLGCSISKLLKAAGADVFKVNLVNDRGIHICKSMLAYSLFANGATPENTKIKGDHFVGDYYVKYGEYEKAEEKKAQDSISQMLQLWEAGDKKTRELWQKMRQWTLDGINQTYKDTGVEFDKIYYESELYKEGKDIVLKGLEKGIFYRDETGAVMADVGRDKPKVLLRSDGTSIYLTQDIGTAVRRHDDYPYTSCIYIVGNEQKDHFKALFAVLKMLGYAWSEKLHHLAYGMVNLPEGRMKTREGTVVDADDMVSSLSALSLENMQDKIKDEKKRKEVAGKVALGALNYYLLSTTPEKDMTFNPAESISFSGNTGPYLQYTGARICSLLAKAKPEEYLNAPFSEDLEEREAELILQMTSLNSILSKSAKNFDPSIMCSYVYNLCKVFSSWYHDEQILKAESSLRSQRLCICNMLLSILKVCFDVLNIPFLQDM